MRDEEPDADLLQLLHLGMRHRVLIGVTDEAYHELETDPDERRTRRQAERLGVLGRLEIPQRRRSEVETLAGALNQKLFPRAVSGSRTDEHNRRDCRQLAAHKILGRELFVTGDRELLKRKELIAAEGITIVSPSEALARAAPPGLVVGSGDGVAVRPGNIERDESDIRRILAPLADDYPDFDGWLTKTLSSDTARIRVAEMDGRVGAVAISKPKDQRVWKLSAFMVDADLRQAGLGGHLLWSEMRAWCNEGLAKVYVTVSTRNEYLVEFFAEFGFLIEGASSRRYGDGQAELVLAKHLIVGRYGADDLEVFAQEVAGSVLLARLPSGPWAHSVLPQSELRWDGAGASLQLQEVSPDQTVERTWSLLDLERTFYPVTLAVSERAALLVPLEALWAESLIEFPGEQLQIKGEHATHRLLLRPDNVYYCYPTAYDVAVAGTPILFYVKAPVMAVVGEARVVESRIAPPEDLYVRFGGLGIYTPGEIRPHARHGGPYDGCALAMRFAQYRPFKSVVAREKMIETLGRPLSGPQGITPITFEDFEALRRRGGL
jgi:N-acetylglutamate synthase-like GNAT family acetyltransferase